MQVKLFIRDTLQKSRFFLKHKLSSVQVIVSYYLLVTLIAIVLFYLPIFRQPGSHVSFIDMLFMAVSTISVTGLSTFSVTDVFNEQGVILLEILFQVGGLGIMMISTFFFILSKRKVTLKQRQLIMTDMNQPRLSGIVRLIRTTFVIILGVQIISGIGFSIYLKLNEYYTSWTDAFYYGFYQAVSSVTNSGFDVTGDSVSPYANDFLFLLTIMFLIFIGGIGFPVLVDVKEWIAYKFHRRPRLSQFRFSLFTKIALLSSVILFIGGSIVIFLLEKNHLFANMSTLGQGIHSMFYAVTTRNGGLQIHDLDSFQTTSLIVFAMLMFIGCSPSSVGGGIRTTTIMIIGLYIYSFLKGKAHVHIFGRNINKEDIRKSIAVFMLSLIMCFSCVVFLTAIEDVSLISIIVEVTSAFGTTGLSLGITSDLSTIGKLVIAGLMFIGRVSMLYTLMLFIPQNPHDSGYRYPTEKIIIG
ncbi:TrkH family potassium uptake protein [Tetragenococcus halophilus]|uniref:TrkH family potassium uptake protein n=1 Tax=Tetragenococcus halophilus TaxID=51669 RepID=UPI003BAE79B0